MNPIKPTILITGSSGLLGCEFIEKFQHKYRIFALTHSEPLQNYKDIEFIDVDFSSEWSTSLLPKSVDFVIHLAQSPKFRDFPISALEVFNINLQSTMKLLDYSIQANVRKFIFASTGGIYGSSNVPITVNSEILGPTGLSHYFGTKLASEIFANNYRSFFHVDVNRIFFMYGPRQSDTMLIPRLIESVSRGRVIQLAGESGIRINPIFVGDVASFLDIQLLQAGSQVYNIAGAEVISIKELCELIQSQLGGTLNFEKLPPANDIVADSSAFLSQLGFTPKSMGDSLKLFAKQI